MNSLFLKIFLWFWLAMALIHLVFVVVTITSESPPGPFRGALGNLLTVYSQTASEILDQQGQSALDQYITRIEQASHFQFFLYDKAGNQIAGRPAPQEMPFLTHHFGKANEVEFEPAFSAVWGVYRFSSQSKTELQVMVCRIPSPQFQPGKVDWRILLFRAFLILLIGGFVCYGLARYLTKPVTHLREATRKLADGDLSARIGSQVGNRRDELAQLARDFDVMAERIETLVSSKRRLLSDISHELRSPLARLYVALGIARRHAGEKAVDALDRIERETQRLDALIGEVLTLARLETDTSVHRVESVDLPQLVNEITADAQYEAGEHHRCVKVVSIEPCTMKGSYEFLRRAVENVVRNAVKYTDEGTTVEVSLKRQHEKGKEMAVIQVRDEGPGVPESELANLFRPFYRVGEARDRQTGGVGLGLAITEQAARLHGGTVRALNQPKGLLIEISLPLVS